MHSYKNMNILLTAAANEDARQNPNLQEIFITKCWKFQFTIIGLHTELCILNLLNEWDL